MRLIRHERSAAATIKAQGQPSLGFNWIEKHRSIEILDRRDRRIVTVIIALRSAKPSRRGYTNHLSNPLH